MLIDVQISSFRLSDHFFSYYQINRKTTSSIKTEQYSSYNHIDYHKKKKELTNTALGNKELHGQVLEKDTIVCPYTPVYLYDMFGVRIDSTITDSLGNYSFYFLESNKHFYLISNHKTNAYNNITQLIKL